MRGPRRASPSERLPRLKASLRALGASGAHSLASLPRKTAPGVGGPSRPGQHSVSGTRSCAEGEGVTGSQTQAQADSPAGSPWGPGTGPVPARGLSEFQDGGHRCCEVSRQVRQWGACATPCRAEQRGPDRVEPGPALPVLEKQTWDYSVIRETR